MQWKLVVNREKTEVMVLIVLKMSMFSFCPGRLNLKLSTLGIAVSRTVIVLGQRRMSMRRLKRLSLSFVDC